MPADMNSRGGAVGAVAEKTRKKTLYVIRNARLDPEWASVDRGTLDIVDRAVSSLIATHSRAISTESYFDTASRQQLFGLRL
jgi:hypothetical protein